MAKDLTTSAIDRQNILNNPMALPKIQEALDVKFLEFQGKYVVTKQFAADFYGVDIRTITNCLNANESELQRNGYTVIKGNDLKEFKLKYVQEMDFPKKGSGKETDFPTKTTVLGIFDFRSFLNLGMLLTTSEKAQEVRSRILDIVIAVMNEKSGGSTKYINRRDQSYVTSALSEENYHRKLTNAIKVYVNSENKYKYSQIMDTIYKVVFCEKASEYKKLLELSKKDSLRRTLYAEVLVAVSSFENATAEKIVEMAETSGILSVKDVNQIIVELAQNPLIKPVVEDARTKMASRDNALRDVYHGNLAAYIRAVMPEEYHKFIGNLSVDFDQLLEDNKNVLEHLKQ
ncbi:MAG: DNA-binding protein [Bacteroidales bacterium]|nr:DNA-binding protein [Bacteroidales bacterium]